MDSQAVLDKYASHLLAVEEPKTMVFTYTVSQAGPHVIDQQHRVYRSGELVRDETLQIDGLPVKPKITRIARYRNRYTIDDLSPRTTQYAFLFLRAVRTGRTYSYVYRAVPLGAPGAFVVDQMTIDGKTYLPVQIRFRTTNGTLQGTGAVDFAGSGKYWVPVNVSLVAQVQGKPARERIVFSAYQFPRSLPPSTFQAPKPLPTPVLPQF
jgi:hypothetical protein